MEPTEKTAPPGSVAMKMMSERTSSQTEPPWLESAVVKSLDRTLVSIGKTAGPGDEDGVGRCAQPFVGAVDLKSGCAPED